MLTGIAQSFGSRGLRKRVTASFLGISSPRCCHFGMSINVCFGHSCLTGTTESRPDGEAGAEVSACRIG